MSIGTAELKEIVRTAVKEAQAQAAPAPKGESEGKHVGHCVDCYREAITELTGKGKYECRECRLPLGDKKLVESLKTCPRCGNPGAREVF